MALSRERRNKVRDCLRLAPLDSAVWTCFGAESAMAGRIVPTKRSTISPRPRRNWLQSRDLPPPLPQFTLERQLHVAGNLKSMLVALRHNLMSFRERASRPDNRGDIRSLAPPTMLRIIYIITEMNARPDQNMSRAARARTLPIGKKLRIGKSVPASKQHLQRPVPSQLRRVRYPPVRTFRP